MKRLVKFFLYCLIFGFNNSFSQTLEWTEDIVHGDNIRTVIGSDGFIYISGDFDSDTVFFNNGVYLTLEGYAATNAFIAKYDNQGKCLWAKKIAGHSITLIKSITLDEYNNIYVGGGFIADTLIFDNDIILFNKHSFSGFIAKYNNNGKCQWAKLISDNITYNYVNSIKIDQNNNLIALWDSGKHWEFTDIFISKFNEDGEILWREKIDASNDHLTYGIKIETDYQNNIYVLGDFYADTLKFNHDHFLLNKGNSDVFISKYSSDGICLWVESIGAGALEFAGDFVIDSTGNLYVIGVPGYGPNDTYKPKLSNGKVLDAKYGSYFVKFNTHGNIIWVEQILGLTNITINSSKDIYLLGLFDYGKDSITFNNGTTLYANNIDCSFFARYNQDGKCIIAIKMDNHGGNINSFVFDRYNNFYISDYSYLKKYNWISTYIDVERFQNVFSIYPNPATDYITINLKPSEGLEPSEGSAVEIYDMMGIRVFSDVRHLGDVGHLNRIGISNLAPGVYFVKIVGSNGCCSIVEKFVKY